MSIQKVRKLTEKEYLEIERKAEFKSEYYDGEMFGLAGASLPHNKITSNIHVSLANQLKGKTCQVFQSDLKIREQVSNQFTYPDIVVICGEPEFFDNEKDVIMNPSIIMEILSKSTESYDRGFKFELYRRINSLKDFFLVSQEKISVEYYTRNTDESWNLKEYNDRSQKIEIKSIDCTLDLNEVYYNVKFNVDLVNE
ncbi:MAG: Uma2 family endonuclease [Bacteroidota bacterium]|nr:Uma2 family endonuclease [Bacteroidota bacterium]